MAPLSGTTAQLSTCKGWSSQLSPWQHFTFICRKCVSAKIRETCPATRKRSPERAKRPKHSLLHARSRFSHDEAPSERQTGRALVPGVEQAVGAVLHVGRPSRTAARSQKASARASAPSAVSFHLQLLTGQRSGTSPSHSQHEPSSVCPVKPSTRFLVMFALIPFAVSCVFFQCL